MNLSNSLQNAISWLQLFRFSLALILYLTEYQPEVLRPAFMSTMDYIYYDSESGPMFPRYTFKFVPFLMYISYKQIDNMKIHFSFYLNKKQFDQSIYLSIDFFNLLMNFVSVSQNHCVCNDRTIIYEKIEFRKYIKQNSVILAFYLKLLFVLVFFEGVSLVSTQSRTLHLQLKLVLLLLCFWISSGCTILSNKFEVHSCWGKWTSVLFIDRAHSSGRVFNRKNTELSFLFWTLLKSSSFLSETECLSRKRLSFLTSTPPAQ